MCLSNVYLKEKRKENLMVEEVSHVKAGDGCVEVRSFMGGSKTVQGYSIGEVDLVENFVILEKREGS